MFTVGIRLFPSSFRIFVGYTRICIYLEILKQTEFPASVIHSLKVVNLGLKYHNITDIPKIPFLQLANEVWERYVFTPVCQSFCSQGGCLGPGPGVRLRGLAEGVSRPTPGGSPDPHLGGLQAHTGVSRPTLGGLQAHTRGEGVSRPRPRPRGRGRGCVSQHALRQTPPPPADGYCCVRYASYWNAFLLEK